MKIDVEYIKKKIKEAFDWNCLPEIFCHFL